MLVEIGYCADYLLIYFLHLCIQYKSFCPSALTKCHVFCFVPISIFHYTHSILDADEVVLLLMHIKCNFLRGPFDEVIRLAAFNGKYKHGKLAKNACDRNFKSLNAK